MQNVVGTQAFVSYGMSGSPRKQRPYYARKTSSHAAHCDGDGRAGDHPEKDSPVTSCA